MSKSRATVVTTAGVAAVFAVGACYYYKSRRRKGLLLEENDLVGNAKASGSDVVRLHQEQANNKLYIVTGATSGLGRHVATLLGGIKGTHIILAVRNVEQGERLAEEIQSKQTEAKVDVYHLDLSSLDSVRAFVEKFASEKKMVDGLINNAGVYCVSGKTGDGYQTTWQTNAMAPALLTELLLSHMTPTARIIHVTSEMERLVGLFGSNDFSSPPESDGSSTWDYAYSKACQVLHAHDLMERFASTTQGTKDVLQIFAVEPGLVQTNIARHASKLTQWINYKLLGPVFLRSLDQGCATILYCLLSPNLHQEKDGYYYYANCAPRKPSRYCTKQNVQALSTSLEQVETQTGIL